MVAECRGGLQCVLQDEVWLDNGRRGEFRGRASSTSSVLSTLHTSVVRSAPGAGGQVSKSIDPQTCVDGLDRFFESAGRRMPTSQRARMDVMCLAAGIRCGAPDGASAAGNACCKSRSGW